MIQQVIIGFITEGSTDIRFLESVIQRSFEDVAFECHGQIEILPIQYIEKNRGNFIGVVKESAQIADERGIMVLCVHADADNAIDSDTFNNKIIPAFTAVNDISEERICKNMVAVVPVQMSEAWMLSDKELLKDEIGTTKSDRYLGIGGGPETFSNPKQVIESAIRIARQDLTRRRRHDLTISELYSPIGQKVPLSRLEELPSYQKFKDLVRDAFRKLNYLL